jgi:type IV pilus assembly protein PilA
MKMSMRNKKGFTLIELLIVIAILGVLAVIAFQAFGGILTSTKEKADLATAKQIEKAIELLMTHTGVVDVRAAGVFKDTADAELTMNTPELLIINLQKGLKFTDPRTGEEKIYGPYLKNPNSSGSATSDSYLKPQFNSAAGGTYEGFQITVNISTNNVNVIPVAAASSLVVNQ